MRVFLLVAIMAFSSSISFASIGRLDRKIINEQLSCYGECAKVLWRNLRRDIRFCRALPKDVENLAEILPQYHGKNWVNIRGALAYRGIMPGPYRYTVEVDDSGVVHVRAKVYLRNLNKYYNDAEIAAYRQRFKDAEVVWENYNPYSFPINFHFELVEADDKFMSVRARLVRHNVRGPYFIQWYLNWNHKIISHEMGHVLGLDDEYSKLIKRRKCLKDSLMCKTKRGTHPLPLHYYLILRRAICHY